MSCCGKSATIRVERTHVAASNRPKIVRTTKHNLSAKVAVPSSTAVKPANDREKYRV